MLPYDQITQETIQAVMKAQTSGWTSGTGVVGIDLQGLVSLIPKYTPFRDQLARVGSTDGAKVTQWKALLNVTNQQPSIFVGFDNAGSLVIVDEQDVFSAYAPIALAGQVTQDSVDIAKGYADAKAIETINVLNMCMVKEDQALGTGAQNYALPAIGTGVASVGAPANGKGVSGANTGGSIAASTAVHIKVAARSGMNYFNGGSGIASADFTATTASGTATNSVGAYVPAVKGAVAYDWFVGTSSSNQTYFTTTTTNTVLITTLAPAGVLPTYEMPDLSGIVPTTPPVADTSFSTNAFNSLLATILGDYGSNAIVTPGSGTGSGAGWTSLDGALLTTVGASIPQLDALNLAVYNSVKLSPSAYMMNAQQANDISILALGSNLAVTFLNPDDPTGRANITAGGYVGSYLNKAYSGQRIRIEVHPSVPPGTIIARTDQVPFPGSNIGNVCEVRTLRDYAEYPYGIPRLPASGPSGPREEFEVRSIETLVNKAPVAHAVLSNIGNAE